MCTACGSVNGQTLIPELLRTAPQARVVLDRYGLRGCGGEQGPAETLDFFARAHDVPLPRLLEELGQVPDSPVAGTVPEAADSIYRPFFKAGILLALTAGAVWGAYLLLRIGFSGSFHAAGLHEVNAHGHAQIFGWVGLFVMGFAYQAFPRFKHTSLAHAPIAFLTLGLMLVGIVTRSICEPFAATVSWFGPLSIAAAALEVVAISLFAWVIMITWRRSGKKLAIHDWYVVCALGWFVAQSICEAIYLAATLAVSNHDQLLLLVATWQGALRDMQIHGFAMLMILGVSQRILHNFYGLPVPSARRSRNALICLNAAIIGEAAGLVLMRSGGHGWASLWYGSVLLLAGSVAALLWNWRVFGRAQEPDRSLKFLRAGYAWLLISLAMLVLLPVYQFVLLPWMAPESAAATLGFSHAYHGAIRHAITVGFISLMIVGVAAKVTPTLKGIDVHGLSPLWLPFVLLNTGCALRVTAQTATDLSPGAFPVAGVSGVLEVLGLTLWGVHLWRIMSGRLRTFPRQTGAAITYIPGSPIEDGHRVGDVLDHHPDMLETFLSLGFRSLTNPLMRRTVANWVTIAQACRWIGVNRDETLKTLNRAAGTERKRTLSLPMISSILLALLLGGLRPGSVRADDLEREPIRYSASTPSNVVSRLEQKLNTGKARLTYEDHFGYLRSLLRELNVPQSSQMLVFSKTSFQRNRIAPKTPRALYFNEDVYVGFCQFGDVLEVSAVDPQLGTVYYTLDQSKTDRPVFTRQGDNCLICHGSTQTQGVPGHLVRSTFSDYQGLPILAAGTYRIDHTSPLKNRWGGWYVTGTHGKQTHLGNLIVRTKYVSEPIDNSAGMNLTSLGAHVKQSDYLTGHSDIVALMVLEHQTEGHNLLTRAAFQTRQALYQEAALNRELGEPANHRWDSTTIRIRSAGDPLVKYLLFSEEASLTDRVAGTSGFAAEFVKRGPRDAKGRSLRDFDLERRLFKYPCSYLIYSPSFDALPGQVKDHVLRRMWDVLNGKDPAKEFTHLNAADRKAILEILVATKPDLPDYWRPKEEKKPR
jgi:hypothetical protein